MIAPDITPSSGGQRSIRAIVVDFGGVMASDITHSAAAPTEELRAFVQFFQQQFSALYPSTDPTTAFSRWETGQLDERQFIAELCHQFEALGHPPLDVEAARQAAIMPGMTASRPMVEAIRALRQAGFATGILTNTGRGATTRWRSVIPVAELFDAVVDSCVDRVRKPDPQAYLLACMKLGVRPDECLFIDDRGWNLAGAQAVGMRTALCRNPAEMARRLRHDFLAGPSCDGPLAALG